MITFVSLLPLHHVVSAIIFCFWPVQWIIFTSLSAYKNKLCKKFSYDRSGITSSMATRGATLNHSNTAHRIAFSTSWESRQCCMAVPAYHVVHLNQKVFCLWDLSEAQLRVFRHTALASSLKHCHVLAMSCNHWRRWEKGIKIRLHMVHQPLWNDMSFSQW